MAIYKCKTCGWEGEIPEGKQSYCRPCHAQNTRNWEKRNHDKMIQYRVNYERKFREQHREIYNARKLKQRSPVKILEARLQRTKWLLIGDVTREQLIDLYYSAKGLCHYCQQKVERPRFTPTDPRGFDHVIARINNGKHTIGNMVVCCRKCNGIKGGYEANERKYRLD